MSGEAPLPLNRSSVVLGLNSMKSENDAKVVAFGVVGPYVEDHPLPLRRVPPGRAGARQARAARLVSGRRPAA